MFKANNSSTLKDQKKILHIVLVSVWLISSKFLHDEEFT